MKYRPELDALRVVAFLGVFATHSMSRAASDYPAFGVLAFVPAALASAGLYGVDLFFVLSAYLITSLLLAEHTRTGRIDRRAFYARRILRIWPLYFAALAAAAVITPHILPKDGLTPGALLAFAVFGGNWYAVAFDLLCPFGVRRGDGDIASSDRHIHARNAYRTGSNRHRHIRRALRRDCAAAHHAIAANAGHKRVDVRLHDDALVGVRYFVVICDGEGYDGPSFLWAFAPIPYGSLLRLTTRPRHRPASGVRRGARLPNRRDNDAA